LSWIRSAAERGLLAGIIRRVPAVSARRGRRRLQKAPSQEKHGALRKKQNQ